MRYIGLYLNTAATVFILFFHGGLSAQENLELDLQTAISEQSGKLAAKDLKGIQWNSPNTFSHFGQNGALLIRNISGDTVNSVRKSALNSLLTTMSVDSVSAVRPYAWLDSDRFVINCKGGLLIYSLAKQNLVKHLDYAEKAENMEFSNKSGYLAYTLGRDVYVATPDNPKIRVTKHEGSETVAGVAIHRSEFGITKGLFWSEDGKKLGFYEMDESMVTNYPLADYNSYPATATPVKYPMAGQKSHQARAGIFDVPSQFTVYLKTGEPYDQYLTNFTFSPDGRKAFLAVVNRGQDYMILNRYSSLTGDLEKTLIEEADKEYVEPEHPPVFPDSSGSYFLWFSERDGYNHLYRYSAEGKLQNQITKGSFDIKELCGMSDKGDKILVKAADGLMDESLYSVDTESGDMKKISRQASSYAVYMDRGDYFLVKHQAINLPNRVAVANLQGEVLSTLIDAPNPLSAYRIGKVEFPVIDALDNTKLQGRLIKPYNFDASKKYPVLVYVYGGPHAQLIGNDITGNAPLWMFHAANRGYIIFTVDGRGSANRGIEFEQAVFRQLGTLEMQDQLRGVDYLKTLSYVNAEKMAVHGWSFGGFMTTSLMLRNPGVFKVGVAGGPVTDWSLYEIMYGERYMDTPAENADGYNTADLKNYTKNLQGNLLLIHGLDDDVVVPQHSYTLLEAFVNDGVPVDFFTYTGHKHNVRGKDRVHLMTKVLDYIDLHIND